MVELVMNRREVMRLLAMGAMSPALLRRAVLGSSRDYSARALKLVNETTAVDMLNQFRFADYADKPPKIERWLAVPSSFTRAEYETYRTSGIRVFALGSGPGEYNAALKFYAEWNGFIATHDDWLMRIDDASDFERVRTSGKVGVMITQQTSDHFRTEDDVDTFFALGQRVSQLTYNYQTRLGAGFLEQNDGGLTVFGSAIVQRMNKIGMAVDVSHCADRTTLDAIAASTKPVLFTHAACRALVLESTRCKTDEMIRAMAKTGGVMGIPFLRFMIRDSEPVTIEHVLDHVDHVVKLVGVEHVGVGSDMDVVGNPNPVNGSPMRETPNWGRYHIHADAEGRITVRGLDHPKRMYDFTEGLIRRGYSDADITRILGGNWARVLSVIWPSDRS